MLEKGYSPIQQLSFPNGQRLGVAAIGPGGQILEVKIQVALANLCGNGKWPDYLDYCDLFYFAMPPNLPHAHVPHETGLIMPTAMAVRSSGRPKHKACASAVTSRHHQL